MFCYSKCLYGRTVSGPRLGGPGVSVLLLKVLVWTEHFWGPPRGWAQRECFGMGPHSTDMQPTQQREERAGRETGQGLNAAAHPLGKGAFGSPPTASTWPFSKARGSQLADTGPLEQGRRWVRPPLHRRALGQGRRCARPLPPRDPSARRAGMYVAGVTVPLRRPGTRPSGCSGSAEGRRSPWGPRGPGGSRGSGVPSHCMES